jgi:hypothetical protein
LLKDIRGHARVARFSREASFRNRALLTMVNVETPQGRIGLRLATPAFTAVFVCTGA